jgi:hypothetical protein
LGHFSTSKWWICCNFAGKNEYEDEKRFIPFLARKRALQLSN